MEYALVAFDVGARSHAFAACIGGKPTTGTLDNTPEAIARWLARQQGRRGQLRVVMEATGIYYLDLALQLVEAGVEVMVLNPKAAHHFAKAMSQRSKTDALDARMLLAYLQRMDFAALDRMPTGQLVARATSDSALVQGLLSFLPLMSGNLLLMLLSLGVMVYLSPLLAVVSLVIVPVGLAVSYRLRTAVFPATWDAQQREGEERHEQRAEDEAEQRRDENERDGLQQPVDVQRAPARLGERCTDQAADQRVRRARRNPVVPRDHVPADRTDQRAVDSLQPVHLRIGIEQRHAQRAEHRRDGRLPHADRSGEAKDDGHADRTTALTPPASP